MRLEPADFLASRVFTTLKCSIWCAGELLPGVPWVTQTVTPVIHTWDLQWLYSASPDRAGGCHQVPVDR